MLPCLLISLVFAAGVSGQEGQGEALPRAAISGNAAEVERLLGAGANADAPDASGSTALKYAAMLGHDPVVEVLLAGRANVNATDADGNFYLGGVKARLKWLPVHGDKEEGGWYFGANIELDRLTKKFSDSPWSTELRVMGGYRAKDWLIGMNPILDWGLTKGYRGSPEVVLAWKAVHAVVTGANHGAHRECRTTQGQS